MSLVTLHSVPRFLTQDQCDDRLSTYDDLIDSANKDVTFLNRIITGDKTWTFLYGLKLKRQSAIWKSPSSSRKKKTRQAKRQGNA
jgi:hypothetical protein